MRSPALRALWALDLDKRALLRQDCAALAAAEQPLPPAVAVQAEVLVEQIRMHAAHDAYALLGDAYVLAVWNMGGATLSRQIREPLRLAGSAGVSFLMSFDYIGPGPLPGPLDRRRRGDRGDPVGGRGSDPVGSRVDSRV